MTLLGLVVIVAVLGAVVVGILALVALASRGRRE